MTHIFGVYRRGRPFDTAAILEYIFNITRGVPAEVLSEALFSTRRTSFSHELSVVVFLTMPGP